MMMMMMMMYVIGTGEFTAESKLLMKIEREKVRARTDPWKVPNDDTFSLVN